MYDIYEIFFTKYTRVLGNTDKKYKRAIVVGDSSSDDEPATKKPFVLQAREVPKKELVKREKSALNVKIIKRKPTIESSESSNSGSEADPDNATDSEDSEINISVMRLEDHKTKTYPCGLCKHVTWHTKIFYHFERCHAQDTSIEQYLQLIQREKDDQYADEDKEETRQTRLKLRQLILNTSTFNHNKKVLNQRKGQYHLLKGTNNKANVILSK